MANDRLRKCPRCAEGDCGHTEFLVANKLAGLGTGVLNIDVLASTMWVASLGKRGELCGRTAFVELKRPGESISTGLEYTYRDITGKLTTTTGAEFEQRGFILWEKPDGTWLLSTYSGAYQTTSATDLDAAIEAIQAWIIYGTLPAPHKEGPAAQSA